VGKKNHQERLEGKKKVGKIIIRTKKKAQEKKRRKSTNQIN
jgi:hypothetical protein